MVTTDVLSQVLKYSPLGGAHTLFEGRTILYVKMQMINTLSFYIPRIQHDAFHDLKNHLITN